jgi:ribosomal 30S subunit maturation factor RimM
MAQQIHIVIGRVRSVTAGRRLLRVTPAEGRRREFEGLEWIYVAPQNERETIRCHVTEVREEPGQYALALSAGVPRDVVARMKGAQVVIAVKEGTAPERTADNYIGLKAVDESGHEIGVVSAVELSPAHDVLEIEKAGGGAILVPAIEQVIASVDWDAGVMVLRDLTPFAVEEGIGEDDGAHRSDDKVHRQ